jgi:predicted ATPase/DNA-binding NarL/FixJ family response regulator
VAQAAARIASADVHGLPPSLTSFVGRSAEASELASLLSRHRMVTVTGPGGVGKTRLACEVTRTVAGQFADGAWMVELAAVSEPALVQAAVATALGIPQAPGASLLDALTVVLARKQLLLVLDNCEHVLAEVAVLCGAILAAADDIRILATSREPAGVPGEVRYRLAPLAAPDTDSPAGTGRSEAVTLFADRAQLADSSFALDGESEPVVARIVARLDGMPLAIELAAARVEALGVEQLLERLDDRFVLLTGSNRLAPGRQRSLAATVQWSYELLSEPERKVFRQLAVFPGPFTLEAAEAVAGADAALTVMHLVDCSLLTPPRTGPDGRARYGMLETLRAYGADRLSQAGEHDNAAARLAAYALRVAEEAAARLDTSTGELGAARWLDAEDATVHQSLAWALEHDRDTALGIALALAPWWRVRGRFAAGYTLLAAAAEHAERGEDAWCAAHYWLAGFEGPLGVPGGLDRFIAVRDALTPRGPSRLLARTLAQCANQLTWAIGRTSEAMEEGRRALTMAVELADPIGELLAINALSNAAKYSDDYQGALAWQRRVQQLDPATLPPRMIRSMAGSLAFALLDAEDYASAMKECNRALALSKEADDLGEQNATLMLAAQLDLLENHGMALTARTNLREAIEIALRVGADIPLLDCLDICALLCAETQRPAEAIVLWAACMAFMRQHGMSDSPQELRRRESLLQAARQALGPAATQAAEERGAAMSLATAAEFALLLLSEDAHHPQSRPRATLLTPREQELVTLVASGTTDAQIAAQLYISVRTVRSHLDRIRDKTGCRRRADLTRLALQTGLI